LSLEEYQKVSITKFNGLYLRGLADDCPPDHSPVCQNKKFNRNGEVLTRDGTVSSLVTSHDNNRMFVASFDHADTDSIVLTCDGAGNIYRSDTGGVLLNVTNMVDFAAINAFGFCLISPILSTPATLDPVYIWKGAFGGSDPVPIRVAAGVGPGTGMSAVENATAGNCDIGVHQIAVSFITNTGYTTQPGPLGSPTPPLPENPTFAAVTVTSTGNKSIQINSIPTGPSGTVARQILLTQADQSLFFYGGGQISNGSAFVAWDGVINDNTTTSIIISFFDTDLAVSADALFDLLPSIPGGNYSLIGGMTFYHGRILYWGGEFNLVRVTNPGSTESIDNVAGFVQLPDQFDGNDVTNSCTLQDVLYFFKNPGIFSVTDNGGDPDTWNIITVDAGAGCTSASGLATINVAAPSLTQNQVALVSDYGGIYLFTGVINQPPLTWKINDLWISIFQLTNLSGTMIAVDPYYKMIYIAIVGNPVNEPAYANLLVADYNDGLDSQNIKWSIWTFPYTIQSIGMLFFNDSVPELAYRLRIGTNETIYKLLPGTTTDNGTAINAIWQSFYISPNPGALNIFRFMRARCVFEDNLNLTLYSQDNAFNSTPPGFTTPYVSGRDITREFNFMDEKCSLQLSTSASNGGFTLQRLDIFCAARFNMRPSV
jgi:hypothetical protein